jgi:FemAB family protein
MNLNNNLLIKDHIQKSLSEYGFQAIFLADSPSAWNDVINMCPYVPCHYTAHSIEYETCYYNSNGNECLDISMIIQSSGNVIGLWPLSKTKINGEAQLTSQGLPICSPLFIAGISRSKKREIINRLYNFLCELAATFNISGVELGDAFDGEFGLSDWHLEALTRNLSKTFKYSSFLQIQGSANLIRKNFRKGARDRAAQAKKIWKSFVLDALSENIDEVWSEFKQLHLEASGRKTRGDDTWNIQKKNNRK